MTTIAMAVWAVMQILLPIIINHGVPPTVGNAVQEPPPPIEQPAIPYYPGDIEQAITDAVGVGPAIPNAWGHSEGWTGYTVIAYDNGTWTVTVNVCRNINCDIVTVYLTPQ